ncbi:MAG: hypothetical protein OMM_14016, partial [Candidatus Magnetoglobus multicellularis str. Araruama]
MSKVLVERRRDKHEELYERLLLVACIASGISRAKNTELETVCDCIENLCLKKASSVFFDKRSNEFRASKRPDMIEEQVLNEAVAWYFDREIRRLLKKDRAELTSYIGRNLEQAYRLNLPEWREKRKEWKQLSKDDDYQEVIRNLEDMGLLINPDEVGELDQEQLEEITSAAATKDYQHLNKLLSQSANELRTYLYSDAITKLTYREPNFPKFLDKKDRWTFNKIVTWVRNGQKEHIQKAISECKELLVKNMRNLDLKDWLAFLNALAGDLASAESLLQTVWENRGKQKAGFVTSWNLAVLAYER